MGMEISLEPLDCEPFYHGYGPECANSHLVFARWVLPLVDLRGNKLGIYFYVTKSDGILLLGNDFLSNSNILGSDNILVYFSEGKEVFERVLPTYTTSDLRTYLHVVPSQTESFETFFSSYKSSQVTYFSSQSFRNKMSRGKQAKDFATRLHIYTHMSVEDMTEICKRAGILTPILKQALKNAFDKCGSCKLTGRPLSARKVSFRRLLYSFNEQVEIDSCSTFVHGMINKYVNKYIHVTS